MMIARLRAVFARPETRPDEEQEALATLWEEILEEREWARIAVTPRVRDALRRMAAEAWVEDEAGETEEITGERMALPNSLEVAG